ncbi:MAG: hypothetical protein IT210_19785 [Armatimonadetes bacterium]|nr:hypothetical protein [Armatimonadota bacterium]
MEPENEPYRPSERILRLRDRAVSRPSELFFGWQRAYYYMEGWMAAEGQPLSLRNVAAYCHVIENMPVLLAEGDLLAGEHGNDSDIFNFRPTFSPDYAEQIRASNLTEEQKRKFIEWAEGQPFRWQTLASVIPWPEELARAQAHGVVSVWGTDLNHSIRGYEKALRLGFTGLRQEAQDALDSLPLTEPDAPSRRANLLGWIRLCDAAAGLGKQYAEKARQLASACEGIHQRKEWEEIARICDRVPADPARTFREAVQSLWFAHILTVWEDGINANGIGRIDQFLWPYLEADLAAGCTTWQEAAECLAAFWLKLYQPYDVQQMMVGGQHADGSDAVNPLSYLVLDVTEGLGLIRCLSARLHSGSPREFVSRCVDLVGKGGGIPFFFNDDALVPALVGKGIPPEEARGYAAIGCVEITIPGKASPHAVSHWINLAKCLELALNDGKDLLDGAQVGPQTGTLSDARSIEEVWTAYTRQVEYFAKWAVYGSNSAEIAHRNQYRLPYLSLLTEDCISRGRDIIEGGARYNYHSSAAMGIPNVADSLAALQSALFESKTVGPEEMLKALRDNYAGREDLRLFLRNRLPKYGNDHALPDRFAAELARHYCDHLGGFRTAGGGTFFCHLFTFTLMLGMGKMTGASPEGRRAGEPLAYSLSPAQSRDREGLTAVVNSLSRLPHHLAAASSSAILEADPSLLEGPGREAFIDLVATAVRQGVGQMQFNVVSAETLKAAQADPERYRNLCVRVSGFSQQFCLLDKEMQDHIIARTKHKR